MTVPEDRRTTVTPYPDGPLLLRGDFELRHPDGTPLDVHRPIVALCRCGKSAIKPFCDGTHKVVGFHTHDDAVCKDSTPPTGSPEVPA